MLTFIHTFLIKNNFIMAISAGFTATVYGTIQGSPPYANADGATAFSLITPFSYTPAVNIPSTGVQIFPLPNGVLVGGSYVYSVISMPPSGLNVHGIQYVSDSSAATLATARG